VPKEVRTRFEIEPGTTLDWQPEGDSIRVVKLVQAKSGRASLNWLRRLGRIPAAPRDPRPVEVR
jgi:bifunctional DNA-binding transcriptional regulator/antitoxin component of YhaV-PrlF toxin-antitoxin module